MRIAGVHIERSILVIREGKSDKISLLKFDSIEKLFNSKEIKRCDNIYINAGENNFLIKTNFYSNKNPDEARNYVLKHLSEFTIGKGKEYISKVTAVSKEKGSNVYIIEGKEEQIQKRIFDLPVEDYKISGVIPDNFAISYPFMLEEKLENLLLIIEVGKEEFILTYLEGKKINFTRSAFFEKNELVDSLKKEMEILLHRIGPVDRIYFTGGFSGKELKKIKKEIPSYRGKIKGIYTTRGLSSDAILAYGLSLTPLMEFDNDLTPEYLATKREELKRESIFRKFARGIIHFLVILISIPLLLLIAGQIWLFVFNQQIERLNNSYEKVKKVQTEVMKLKERLKMQEDARTLVPWGAFLFEVSRIIPDDVCLIELESEPTMEEDKKGFILHLIGEGKTQEAVMQFYSKMQDIEMIGETNIKKIKNEKGITTFDFVVTLYSE